MIPAIEAEVFEQHALEAGMLWLLRDGAARDAAHDLASLCELDGRLEAHLDGLRLAGDSGWQSAKAALDGGEAGEVFTAALLALERGDLRGLALVLDLAEGAPDLSRGVVSALGWASFEHVQRVLPGLLDGRCPPELHRIGITACAVHRQHPGPVLGYSTSSPDAPLRARALRAAGELGRTELSADLRHHLASPDLAARFWAAWSLGLMGDPGAAEALWQLSVTGGPNAERAADLAMRIAPKDQAAEWLRSLTRGGGEGRVAIVAAAALGDPAFVRFLLERMAVPELARLAGAAFTMITGVDLWSPGLRGKKPEGFEPGPNDDPDDPDVAMDPDSSLPWPETSAVQALWAREPVRLSRGARHLLGREITPAWLDQVLRTGNQPARAAAALELSIARPGRVLFEVRAPGPRQLQSLGAR